MADDDIGEDTAGSPTDAGAAGDGAVAGGDGAGAAGDGAGAGGDGAVADGDDAAHVGESATSAEPPKELADKDRSTPRSAAKLAGIVVGAVLLCAAVVVAAVWVIDEVVDEDDESWLEYVPSSALAEDYGLYGEGPRSYYDDDGHHDEYYKDDHRRGYGKGRSADDDRPKWHDKDRFTEPDFWSRSWRRGDGCRMPFGVGANVGPVVVLVVPGLGLGNWGTDGAFGWGGLGGGPRGLPPDMAPFLEQGDWSGTEQWPGEWGSEGSLGGSFVPGELGEEFYFDPEGLLKELFEGANHQVPEPLDETGLEATESDNTESHDGALGGPASAAPT